MTIAVPVSKRMISSMTAKSPKKCRVNTATEIEKAIVKDKNASDVTKGIESSPLSPEVRPPRKHCRWQHRRFVGSKMKIFEIYTKHKNSIAARIWPRA